MTPTCIMLIGMPGVGKSTVGRALAAKLGFSFQDVDSIMSRHEHISVQQLVDKYGDTSFIEKEAQYLRQLPISNTVIAPGGSIIYHTDAMDEMAQKSTIVYLKDSMENIQNRISNLSLRGIVGLNNRSFQDIYAERTPLYEKYAAATVECAHKSIRKISDEITQCISVI